jgi:hypothetical protein
MTVAIMKMTTVRRRNIQRTKAADGSAVARPGTRLRMEMRLATPGTDIVRNLLVLNPRTDRKWHRCVAIFLLEKPSCSWVPTDIESQH